MESNWNNPGLFLVLASILLAPTAVFAADIRYQSIHLGGNQWEYRYTVVNNGSLGGDSVRWFTIDFDPAVFDVGSLTITTEAPLAVQWDEHILPPAVAMPAIYDILSLGTGIAEGQSAGFFSVRFTWLGAGEPGSQRFSIYDPDTFSLLEQGQTSQRESIPIPLGGPWLSIVLVLWLLAAARGRLARYPKGLPA